MGEANEMHLMNNKISKLLDNPDCPKLRVLFLQGNSIFEVVVKFEEKKCLMKVSQLKLRRYSNMLLNCFLITI